MFVPTFYVCPYILRLSLHFKVAVIGDAVGGGVVTWSMVGWVGRGQNA